MHIATDGETYGHHHAFGEMALGHALNHIEENNLARLTNYGEYLELHPATHEVQIIENSSWSCCTALSAGEVTAAATRAGTTAGTSNGESRFGTPWTGSVVSWLPVMRKAWLIS